MEGNMVLSMVMNAFKMAETGACRLRGFFNAVKKQIYSKFKWRTLHIGAMVVANHQEGQAK